STESVARAPAQKKTPSRAGLSYKEQKELSAIEAHLADLERQIGELEQKLSDPVAFGLAGNHQEIAAMAGELEALKAETDGSYERWLILQEKAESGAKRD